MVGPAENFSSFSVFSKYVLMFDMLAGRLELFPMLILFHPSCWKKY
jgi:trk system potassium uptake protein TrkH